MNCPYCDHSLTDADVKRLWAQRNAVKRETYTGGIYWKKHNPATARCRCKRCMKRRTLLVRETKEQKKSLRLGGEAARSVLD